MILAPKVSKLTWSQRSAIKELWIVVDVSGGKGNVFYASWDCLEENRGCNVVWGEILVWNAFISDGI